MAHRSLELAEKLRYKRERRQSWPELHWTIENGGSLEEVARLLDEGADINAGGGYGTALAAAAIGGRAPIVSLLLDRGANINIVDGGHGTALAAATFGGRDKIVSLLLDRGVDINAVGGKHGTALAAAAFKGRMQIVSLLLDRGADIDAVGGEYGTALAAAAFCGRTQIVSLLLRRGADINRIGGRYGTALVAGVSGESMDTVSLLLDRGADIDVVGGEGYETALTAAVMCENMDIALLLLDQGRGADINQAGGRYGTALATAAFHESTDIILLLLERGADINKVAGEYGTALATAAYGGSTDIVSLLLDQGADMNTVDGEYGAVLTSAALGGSLNIVSLLLDRGADIGAVSGKYGTALAAAALGGCMDIVSLLLDRGADINAVGGKYGTALATAFSRWSSKEETPPALLEVVFLLLARGADINTIGGIYGTALAEAASRGNELIVDNLLGREANIHVVGGKYGTILVAAAVGGSKDIVSLLLDRGADINAAVSEEYGTALAAAVLCKRMDIVSLLLDQGAEVNQVGGRYGTILATAAFSGSEDIVSELLDRGADINAVGGEYGTALAVAAFGGRTQIVSLLLDRGAEINTVGGRFGTALAAAADAQRKDLVSLLVSRGADINLVTSEFGTILAQAIYQRRTETALLLLEHGADVMRVGGSYSTTSGVYPSALDVVALLEVSSVDPALLALLETATGNQHRPGGQPTNLDVDPVDNVAIVSRPPFPMPYTGLLPPNLHSVDTPITPTTDHNAGVITPEEAGVLCREFNEEDLGRSLAALVGLHEGTTQAKCHWIRNDVRYFSACNFDFGLAYAAARVAWKHFNEVDSNIVSIQRSQWHKHAQVLDEVRSKAIEIDHSSSEHVIKSPYSVMPRRLWDLKSNRLVEFRMLHAAQSTVESNETPPTFWAVSHSWTSDMSPVWTIINQHQWPVPLPRGITFGHLRSELLSFGAEYVWLDVVCLRQHSDVNSSERLRWEEWGLDVPTIGNIYRKATKIVRYFNGLGLRFSHDGWDDSRHWLQRAWTLQEIANERTTINGGITGAQGWPGRVLLNSQGWVSGRVITLRAAIRPVIQLAAQVDGPWGCEIYKLAQEIARRHASQPVDKISALFYLLRATKLPCYNASMTCEDIWRQCFYLLPVERKAELLFDFPYRGFGEQWFPSWVQFLEWPQRDPAYDHMRFQSLPDLMRDISGEASLLISNAWIIPHAILNETDYPGEYEVEISHKLFGFYLPYLSQEPITIEGEPVFTLAVADLGHGHNWVVCNTIEKRAGTEVGLVGVAEVNILKKVGVMRTDAWGELLAGGESGASLIQKMDCLFI